MEEEIWALSFLGDKEFREKFEKANDETEVEHTFEISREQVPQKVLEVLKKNKQNFIVVHEPDEDDSDFIPKAEIRITWTSKMDLFHVRIEQYKPDSENEY